MASLLVISHRTHIDQIAQRQIRSPTFLISPDDGFLWVRTTTTVGPDRSAVHTTRLLDAQAHRPLHSAPANGTRQWWLHTNLDRAHTPGCALILFVAKSLPLLSCMRAILITASALQAIIPCWRQTNQIGTADPIRRQDDRDQIPDVQPHNTIGGAQHGTPLNGDHCVLSLLVCQEEQSLRGDDHHTDRDDCWRQPWREHRGSTAAGRTARAAPASHSKSVIIPNLLPTFLQNMRMPGGCGPQVTTGRLQEWYTTPIGLCHSQSREEG